jgi:hypothetical protein
VRALVLALLLATLASAQAAQRVFDLREFQRDSGAIVLAAPSAIVDPYFASKALLVAHASGLDVRAGALRWIDWMLGKQLPDGRFQRYVLHDVRDVERLGEIADYAPADADDALLAVWIELLSKVGAPCEARSAAVLPPAWTRSLDLATQALARLQDAGSGIYHISAQQPVGLLMDNVEVFGAWRHVADFYAGCGEGGRALAAQRRAAALAASIDQIFWQRAQRRYSASTQVRESFEFYPDGVAQFYPLLGELPNRRTFESADFGAWLRAHAGHWRAAARHDFPWGLVAVAAQRAGARDVAACWLREVDNAREGERRGAASEALRWNVLEEAAYQSLRHELGEDVPGSNCQSASN